MLLDDYAKRKHQCFVTEMFLNPAKTAYTVCFRPTTAGMDSADRNSCRYCEIEATEALNAGTAAAFLPSITEKIDKELVTLSPPA